MKRFDMMGLARFALPNAGLYFVGIICWMNAAWYFRMSVVYHTPLDPNYIYGDFYSALSLLAMFLGGLFFAVALWLGRTARTQTDLVTVLAEHEERIQKLEEQIAALTPPTPAR